MSILGIILGMVVFMVVGALWYSKPLFGAAFFKLAKIKEEKPTGRQWAGAVLNAFLVSAGLSYALGVASGGFLSGVSIGLTFGIFFAIPPIFGQVLWAKMPMGLFWIHAGGMLVSMALVGGVVALI